MEVKDSFLLKYMSYLLIFFFLIFIVVLIFLFYKEWKRLRNIQGDWQPNDLPKAINMIVEDINKAQKRVLIYGGECNFYYEDSIVNAILDALRRRINIDIICENGIFTLGDNYRKSITQEELSYLFSATTNRKVFKNHFRVIDYDYVYIEKPHLPGTDDRFYKRLSNTRFLPGDYSKEFCNIRETALVSHQ